MKQSRFLPAVVLISGFFALASCRDALSPSMSRPEGGFWAYSEIKGYYTCPAELLFEGSDCIIYGETARNIQKAAAKTIADRFDQSICPKITGAFGSLSLDLDRNGKIIILLLKIEDNDNTPLSYITGYFDPNDLLNSRISNQGEILYINTEAIGTGDLYSTIAHELQHLINRSQHLTAPMDVWIDEGLSSAAEYIYDGPQSGRLNWFNGDPLKTIRRGNNFFVWNGSWEKGSGETEPDFLSDYATVYLFFQWLRIHAANGGDSGLGIYRDIIDSSFSDYRAVTSAAKSYIPALGLGNDHALNWETLIGSWHTANRLRADSGIYGYNKEVAVNFFWSYPKDTHSAPLYPGEGVYSVIAGPITPSGGGSNIRYLNLGDYLVTFNVNTDSGGAESGYTADIAIAPLSGLALFSVADEPLEPPEQTLRRWDGARVFLEKRDAAIGNTDY
jgi:hypothetical protein